MQKTSQRLRGGRSCINFGKDGKFSRWEEGTVVRLGMTSAFRVMLFSPVLANS
jgi:hypothetical protein